MKGVEILIKLNDKVSKGLGVINNNLHKTTQKLSDIENSTKSLDKLRTGALIAGGAIAVGLGMATHKAIQFSSALAPVKTVLSGTADEVESASARIGKHALSWSSQYKNSAEEYLGASYNLLSAGLNETQAIAGTNMALKLATATLGDATTSSALLGTLYNNFGNKAGDANKEMMMLSDTVAKTQQLFQIANLGQLNEGLKYATASALSFRVSFDQTSAVVGQLNTLGLTGSMAGTSFNAMMGKLNEGSEKLGYTVAKTADGGIDLVKTLRNISSVGADADTIKKVFGDEGAKGVTLLTAKIGDLESDFKKVQQSAGATEVAFDKMNNTTENKLTVFFNNITNIGIAIGSTFNFILGAVLSFVNPVLQVFSYLIAEHKWFAQIIGFVGVALTGLLLTFGSYVFWVKMGTLVTGFFGTIMTATSTMAGSFGIAMTGLKMILSNPVILLTWARNITLLSAGLIKAGASAMWTGIQMHSAWILGLGPLGWVIGGIEGLLLLFAIFGDSAVNTWNSWTASMENSNVILKTLWGVLDFFIGNTLRGLKWLVDGFKKFLGMLGQEHSVDIKTPEMEKLENINQQITPTYTSPTGLTSLNKDILLPLSHTNFLAKNGLLGEGIHLPATSEMPSTVPNAGSIVRNTATKININDKNKTSPANKSTVINIANIEIADGVISNLEDFILQLNQRVIV